MAAGVAVSVGAGVSVSVARGEAANGVGVASVSPTWATEVGSTGGRSISVSTWVSRRASRTVNITLAVTRTLLGQRLSGEESGAITPPLALRLG